MANDNIWTDRAHAVASVPSHSSFVDLVRLSGLDPRHDLRFADWSGCSFAGLDLVGFDFTGARLLNCSFEGARIMGACFDQAEIDRVQPYARLDPNRTRLSRARDYLEFVRSWRLAKNQLDDSHLPIGAIFQDAPFAPEMVVAPSGTYLQGDETMPVDGINRRRVTIGYRLAVGRFPVTFEEWDFAQGHHDWQRLTGQETRRLDDHGWGRHRQPVINVLWNEAQAYARWLFGVTGQGYRLLTEAEWEYCCRAGTTSQFCNGDDERRLGEVAWFIKNSNRRPQPVDKKASNSWGLHDMHGNVPEWCEDTWKSSYDGAPDDGEARNEADQADYRVIRGGNWAGGPQQIRSGSRNAENVRYPELISGFRLARTLRP